MALRRSRFLAKLRRRGGQALYAWVVVGWLVLVPVAILKIAGGAA